MIKIITKSKRKAILNMSYIAFLKMRLLVDACPTEIAFHGDAERLSDTEYLIKDILLFKQYVDGGSTTTDYMEYQMWKYTEVPDDVNLLCHIHSHVGMPAFRSSRDAVYQKDVIETDVSDDGFYIFMVTNKKAEYHITIVNKKTQEMWATEYGNIETCVSAPCHGRIADDFLQQSMKLVRPIKELPPQIIGYGSPNRLKEDDSNGFDTVSIFPDSGCFENGNYDPDEDMLEWFTMNDPFARNEV